MRKFGHDSIQSIIKLACKQFFEEDSAPDFVSFFYKGHYVEAEFEWSYARRAWYLNKFDVFYTNSVMRYFVGRDFDLVSAWCW